MREKYLDIMENIFREYSIERVDSFLNEVKQNGLTEHGFPVLTCVLGNLIANDRCKEYFSIFIEMMDLCCMQMPYKKAENEFSVARICGCLKALEDKKLVDNCLLEKWKNELKKIDPWTNYNKVAPTPTSKMYNWALFGAYSEFIRGKYLGVDTSKFVEWHISTQVLNFNSDGQYIDAPINPPIMYDLVSREIFLKLLKAGYNGDFYAQIEDNILKSSEMNLKIQSATGEIPFGGRSNQFFQSELLFASLCEMLANKFKQNCDIKLASKFKAAANLALAYTELNIVGKGYSHVKNKYSKDSKMGCEQYAYYNKYMINAAQYAYMAYINADDTIKPSVAPVVEGGYVYHMKSNDFDKVFASAGGYSLQFEFSAGWENNTIFPYEAHGLGRVHKIGAPSCICLSMSFPNRTERYKTEGENKSALSICPFVGDLLGAQGEYQVLDKNEKKDEVSLSLACKLNDEICVKEDYVVNKDGVDVNVSGHDDVGIMIPVFDFDGRDSTKISVVKNQIKIEYDGWVCCYYFNGKLDDNYELYYNRNGRYRAYKMYGNNLKIKIEQL